MAGLVILASFFAEGSFAKRVVLNHAQLQSQTVANGLEFDPGYLQRVAAPRMQVGPSPLFNPDSISTSIQGDGDWRPDLPTAWKSTGGSSSGPPEFVNYVRPPQKPREDFPEGEGKFHRFIKDGDDTLEPYLYNSVTGYVDKTPDIFLGQRRDGIFKGSFRVLFNVPGDADDPKLLRTIELLKSYEKDNPSLAAVEVPLPFDMSVIEKATENGARIVVTKVNSRSFLSELTRDVEDVFNLPKRLETDVEDRDDDKRGNANIARIKPGDIIRAVSIAEPDPKMGAPSGGLWKRLKAQAPVPEDGMAMLDGMGVSQYEAALQESVDRNGKNAKVVLLIERPVAIPPPRGSDDWWDGLKFPTKTELSPVLIPIPVPVDRPDPRYPPLPRGGQGPQGYPSPRQPEN